MRMLTRLAAMVVMGLVVSGCIISERDIGEVLTPISGKIADGTYRFVGDGKADFLYVTRMGDRYAVQDTRQATGGTRGEMTIYQLDSGVQVVKSKVKGDSNFGYSFFTMTDNGFQFMRAEVTLDKLPNNLKPMVDEINVRGEVMLRRNISAGEMVTFLRGVYRAGVPMKVIAYTRE